MRAIQHADAHEAQAVGVPFPHEVEAAGGGGVEVRVAAADEHFLVVAGGDALEGDEGGVFGPAESGRERCPELNAVVTAIGDVIAVVIERFVSAEAHIFMRRPFDAYTDERGQVVRQLRSIHDIPGGDRLFAVVSNVFAYRLLEAERLEFTFGPAQVGEAEPTRLDGFDRGTRGFQHPSSDAAVAELAVVFVDLTAKLEDVPFCEIDRDRQIQSAARSRLCRPLETGAIRMGTLSFKHRAP